MRGGVKCQPGCVCKKHSRVSAINWADPDQRRAYNRAKATERYGANPEPIREAARRWRAANPGRGSRDRDRPSEYKWRYGITAEDVAAMTDKQEGLCYLCGEPLDFEKPRAVHIDHDKSCCRGRRSCGSCVRGLACHMCNTGIGHFGDDPERMRRAADNLEMANRSIRSGRESSAQPRSAINPRPGPITKRH
jgi:hypothetical protein